MTSAAFPGSPQRGRGKHRGLSALLCVVLTLAGLSALARADALPTLGEKVAGTVHMEGYFDLYWDAASGRLYWEIDKLDTEFLYQVSMGSGLGSNPVGIDRGQLGHLHVLEARRRTAGAVGGTQLPLSGDERQSLEREGRADAFATSVHWGFDIVAEGEGQRSRGCHGVLPA
jgi:hypothetical protein